MDLPDAVNGDLALVADVSDPVFKKLAKGVFGGLLGSTDDILAGADGDPADLKRAYAGLTAAVLEATRVDVDEESFVRVVEEAGVSSERAGAIGQGYTKYRESLRSELATTTFGFPKIVGV